MSTERDSESEHRNEPKYRVNGHEWMVAQTFDHSDSEILQCRECLCKAALDPDDDPDDYLGLVTDECQIVWLRDPAGKSHGIALRNRGGFRGRELIGVREGGKLGEGEVVDSVRVYDDDAPELASLLDKQNWDEVAKYA